MSEQPATDAGTTHAAGDDVQDQEFAAEVAGQTSSDLGVEGAFERESEGAGTDVEAAKESGDDVA